MTYDATNINKSNWIIDFRFKNQGKTKQPDLINEVINASWQLKINLGTNIVDPPNCGNCRKPAKVVLRWFMMINGAVESAETYCHTCGRNNLTDIQNNPEKLGNVEIITPNWKERLEEIKENFEELWIANKDISI